MKFISVYIERFGQFYQWSQTFGEGSFLVLYGPNEAGKSTLMAFIKAILFGFPKKTELRPYISGPIEKLDIGGTLTIEIESIGRIKIERYLHKNEGQATLYLPHGDLGDEDDLQRQWLKGYSRRIYDSIFSFNLEGLKDLDRMKADEFNHYLFSTGMMGSSNIFKLENHLQKKAAHLFKPSGSVPPINKLISELSELKKKLTSWHRTLDDYKHWKQELTTLLDQQGQEEERLKATEHRHAQFLKYKACESLFIDYQFLLSKITEFTDHASFPDEGLSQYEQWHGRIVTLQGEAAELRSRQAALKERMQTITVDTAFIAKEEEIYSLRREYEFIQSVEPEFQVRNESLRLEQKEYALQLQKLGVVDASINIETLQTGFHIKQELKELLQRFESLKQKHQVLETTIDEQEDFITQLQETCNKGRENSMPDDQFQALETAIFRDQDRQLLIQEKQMKQQQMGDLEARKQTQKRIETLMIGLPSGFLLSLFVLGVVLIYFGAGLSGGLTIGFGLLFAAASFLIMRSLKGRQPVEPILKAIKKEMQRIDELLNQKSSEDQQQLKESYQVEKSKRDQLRFDTQRLEEAKQSYKENITRFDNVRFEMNQALAEIKQWAKVYGFPIVNNAVIYLDIYDLIEGVKERKIRMHHLEVQQQEHVDRKEAYEHKLEMLQQELEAPEYQPFDFEADLVKYKENQSKRRQLEDTIQELQEQEAGLMKKIARYQEECDKLLTEAGVETEEAFRHLAKRAEELRELKKQRESLWLQINHVVPQQDFLNQAMRWFETGYWAETQEEELIQEVKALKESLASKQKRIADLNSAIRQLEETIPHADLKHEYEEKRSELNDLAKQWAVYRTAKELLTEAKEAYRKTQLPKVLHQASEYIKEITAGRYKNIFFSEEDQFILELTEGKIIPLYQLSRGTKEQVYVSLRLALAAIFSAPYALPLFIDDGFVNFDDDRKEQTINLLKKIAVRRQVIILTCHEMNPNQGMERIDLSSERMESYG
ncbi:uncharacterized protein YhaN [Pullulanibacillus pueri]|uniref:YhaN AAA domain-containing protein n=1 Tax=Pullulanibacillus pueri TaxID=1437324 RepID=A0A8J2ZZC8_9BACL|nr:AAA family ATPase [Pullulanibacillus pueri]MBM7683420.1 uncharacterized protein YhaN [Pullulanibacillus pueri]GGH88075.1 hypothetical protein GCM10007096_39560 [Pullulanibacillus pueri]